MTTPDITAYAIAADGSAVPMNVIGPNDYDGRYVASLRMSEGINITAVEIYYNGELAETVDTDIKTAPSDFLQVAFKVRGECTGMLTTVAGV